MDWPRYVAHQAYYSLIGRDYEWELMPLAIDQRVGAVVWSPLGWGRLTGKIRRGHPLPETSRLHGQKSNEAGPPVDNEYLFKVVDALDAVAKETGKTVPQIALNWLLQRPTRGDGDHRSPERRATAAEPRRGRLEAHAGTNCRSWMRPATCTPAVSLLASAGVVQRAESEAGIVAVAAHRSGCPSAHCGTVADERDSLWHARPIGRQRLGFGQPDYCGVCNDSSEAFDLRGECQSLAGAGRSAAARNTGKRRAE